MTYTILRGDAADLPLDDDSVDLVVTSPPYFGLRSYKDGGEHYEGQIGAEATPAEFIDNLTRCTREWMRVLKPSGSLWVNLGDKYNAYNGNRGRGTLQSNEPRQKQPSGAGLDVKTIKTKSLLGLPWRYALACIDEVGLILRAEVVWSKPNGLPESVTDRVRRSHEQWFHFTVRPRYYCDLDPLRESHKYGGGLTWDERKERGVLNVSGHTRGPQVENGGTPNTYFAAHPGGRIPGSVWSIPTQPLVVPPELGVDHFAAFPMEWPRRMIRGWCPPGGVVLDPFGGTGTTALVADVEGRHGISVDLSADYCRLAEWRCADPKQRARAAGVKPAARARKEADAGGGQETLL